MRRNGTSFPFANNLPLPAPMVANLYFYRKMPIYIKNTHLILIYTQQDYYSKMSVSYLNHWKK